MTTPAQAPAAGQSADWRQVDAALHRFFRGRIADPQLRADLVQDVLLRMHERREQLREDDRLEAWAYRIARNTLVDHHRRQPQAQTHALPEDLAGPAPEPHNDAPRVLGAWLRARVDELPPRYREVLELTELQGYSQRDAAELLGLPYSTLKSRVQRGRERLHAELLGCCAIELDVRGGIQDYAPRNCAPCDCSGSS